MSVCRFWLKTMSRSLKAASRLVQDLSRNNSATATVGVVMVAGPLLWSLPSQIVWLDICLSKFAVYYFKTVHGLVSNALGHVHNRKAVLCLSGSIANGATSTIALTVGPLIFTIDILFLMSWYYRDICQITEWWRKGNFESHLISC